MAILKITIKDKLRKKKHLSLLSAECESQAMASEVERLKGHHKERGRVAEIFQSV